MTKPPASSDTPYEERLPGDEDTEAIESTRHGKVKTRQSVESVIDQIEKKSDAARKTPIHRKV